MAEASPGQFEVNLRHTDDILLACDHALALKRLVRLVAENHDMHATFMAKPYEDYAGSGMRARQYAGPASAQLFVDAERGFTAIETGIGRDDHPDAGVDGAAGAERQRLPALPAGDVCAIQPPGNTTTAPWRCAFLRRTGEPPGGVPRRAGADANPYLVMAAICTACCTGWTTRCRCPSR